MLAADCKELLELEARWPLSNSWRLRPSYRCIPPYLIGISAESSVVRLLRITGATWHHHYCCLRRTVLEWQMMWRQAKATHVVASLFPFSRTVQGLSSAGCRAEAARAAIMAKMRNMEEEAVDSLGHGGLGGGRGRLPARGTPLKSSKAPLWQSCGAELQQWHGVAGQAGCSILVRPQGAVD